jgi:hypothetical protein
MRMPDVPSSADIAVDTRLCGREDGAGGVCGCPAAVWVVLDSEDWDGYQAAACADHSAELLAFGGARVSSDAPLDVGDEKVTF